MISFRLFNLTDFSHISAESSSKEVSIAKLPKLEQLDKMAKLDEFPPEILIKIFKFLKPSDIHKKVALVNIQTILLVRLKPINA